MCLLVTNEVVYILKLTLKLADGCRESAQYIKGLAAPINLHEHASQLEDYIYDHCNWLFKTVLFLKE